MSVDHTYEIGRDDSSTVFLNISGLDKGGNPLEELEASVYAYDATSGDAKFTCRLSIEQLRQLHHHLSKYSLVTDVDQTEAGKFVEVVGSTEQLLGLLSAANEQALLPALKNLVLSRLSEADISTILGRRDSLEEYAEMLADPTSYAEPDWQAFFERNEWIFGYGLSYRYLQIVQREAHVSRTSLTGSNDVIADFLLSDKRFTKLVELKKPTTRLFESRQNRSDSWRLSVALTDAVSQILAQKANWELEAANRTFDAGGRLITESAADVECILVIGTHAAASGSDQEADIKRRTLELYRRNLRNIEVVLFDELLERASYIVDGPGEEGSATTS